MVGLESLLVKALPLKAALLNPQAYSLPESAMPRLGGGR